MLNRGWIVTAAVFAVLTLGVFLVGRLFPPEMQCLSYLDGECIKSMQIR